MGLGHRRFELDRPTQQLFGAREIAHPKRNDAKIVQSAYMARIGCENRTIEGFRGGQIADLMRRLGAGKLGRDLVTDDNGIRQRCNNPLSSMRTLVTRQFLPGVNDFFTWNRLIIRK